MFSRKLIFILMGFFYVLFSHSEAFAKATCACEVTCTYANGTTSKENKYTGTYQKNGKTKNYNQPFSKYEKGECEKFCKAHLASINPTSLAASKGICGKASCSATLKMGTKILTGGSKPGYQKNVGSKSGVYDGKECQGDSCPCGPNGCSPANEARLVDVWGPVYTGGLGSDIDYEYVGNANVDNIMKAKIASINAENPSITSLVLNYQLLNQAQVQIGSTGFVTYNANGSITKNPSSFFGPLLENNKVYYIRITTTTLPGGTKYFDDCCKPVMYEIDRRENPVAKSNPNLLMMKDTKTGVAYPVNIFQKGTRLNPKDIRIIDRKLPTPVKPNR